MAMSDRTRVLEMYAAGFVTGALALHLGDDSAFTPEQDPDGTYNGAVVFTAGGRRYRLARPELLPETQP